MIATATEILLLDIGNSRIKWGTLARVGYISGVDARPHHRQGVASIATHYWSTMSPQRVVAANVAGNDLAGALQAWVWAAWHVEIEFLQPQAHAHGVNNAYHDPSCLGADRWAALLGAARQPHGHLCVVDCGTAITLDALSTDNLHLGGLIIPGLGLMRESLVSGTMGIRQTTSTEKNTLLACDTGSAVAGGTLYAVVALIDRVVADLTAELRATVTVLLTGGDAPLIAPLLAGPVVYEAELIFHGLALVAGFNHAQIIK